MKKYFGSRSRRVTIFFFFCVSKSGPTRERGVRRVRERTTRL